MTQGSGYVLQSNIVSTHPSIASQPAVLSGASGQYAHYQFYITAGLTAIDSADIGTVGTNAFYSTAGLVANDYVAAAGGSTPAGWLKVRGSLRGSSGSGSGCFLPQENEEIEYRRKTED